VVCLSVPTNVSASDGTFADRVEVTWADTSTEQGYEVYRCRNPNTGSCELIGQTVADITSYGDTEADADGGSHRYRVKACRDSGTCSDFSDSDTGFRALEGSQYTIGGTVSGLEGSGLVLQNNGGDDLSISGNGSFTFATALDDLSSYTVTVLTQPIQPDQTCSVFNGSGTLAGDDVIDVSVSCVTSCNVHTLTGVTDNSTVFHEACEILVVGPEYLAQDGASVFLSGGWEIWFIPGFTVENGASLSAEVCGQSLCKTSPSPMPFGCHSCVVQICDIDPACCDTAFDQDCVDEVNTVCGLVCE
jgi:hypothetical protein